MKQKKIEGILNTKCGEVLIYVAEYNQVVKRWYGTVVLTPDGIELETTGKTEKSFKINACKVVRKFLKNCFYDTLPTKK
jgi:hypothetical protein